MPQIGPVLAYRHALHILKKRGKHNAVAYFELHGLTPEEAVRLVTELESEQALQTAEEVARV